jgi:Tfp pilus assembly protein PilE
MERSENYNQSQEGTHQQRLEQTDPHSLLSGAARANRYIAALEYQSNQQRSERQTNEQRGRLGHLRQLEDRQREQDQLTYPITIAAIGAGVGATIAGYNMGATPRVDAIISSAAITGAAGFMIAKSFDNSHMTKQVTDYKLDKKSEIERHRQVLEEICTELSEVDENSQTSQGDTKQHRINQINNRKADEQKNHKERMQDIYRIPQNYIRKAKNKIY